MVKKWLAWLLVFMLAPCVALAASRVFDEADLMNTSEVQALEEKIASLQQTYQVDVVILTSYDAPYDQSLSYADRYYVNHGFGIGEDDAGFLFFIDMLNRQPTIYTRGVMIDYITDNRLDNLLECGYDDLADGRYGRAAMTVLKQLEKYLRQGREEGSFRYDAQTGKRLSGLYNTLTRNELIAAAGAGVAASLLLMLIVRARYNLKGSTYRYDLAEQATRTLTVDEEQFMHQHVTRRVKTQDHGGGSSGGGGHGSAVHRSSGGGFHGGGSGRRF